MVVLPNCRSSWINNASISSAVLSGPIGGVGEIEDALQPGQHLRLLPQLLDELGFLRGELETADGLLHPDFIGASGCICTFYSAEIFPAPHPLLITPRLCLVREKESATATYGATLV